MKTEVDPDDGSINVKKLEPKINCVTPDLTYCLRCNSDVTSLLSGTSIKAVVAYISDYVTKSSLKMYHMFDAIRAVLNLNTESIGQTKKNTENSRVLLMQMVNSLTSKLQIGSPMASLYLLNNPDHYTNYKFKVFWWKSFVAEVKKDWLTPEVSDGKPIEFAALETDEDKDQGDETDRVVLLRTREGYTGATNVDDYVFRPLSFETTSLFD
jgi:hypothetical protein